MTAPPPVPHAGRVDIYVVVDRGRAVGASARLQGAELIRVEYAERLADETEIPRTDTRWPFFRDDAYDALTIDNVELRDTD